MTLTTPDVTTIDHLDFDPVLPCDLHVCDYGRPPATHRYYGDPPCGCHLHFLACPADADQLRAMLARDDVTAWRCTTCHAALFGALTDWMRLEPLRPVA